MGETGLLNCRKETAHFIFYCLQPDAECLEDLSDTLEGNCQRIMRDLQLTLEEKVEVKIYPDIKTFHREAMGNANLPEWLAGCAQPGLIHIVSPKNPGLAHDYNGILKIAVHEFTHTLIKRIRPGGVWKFLDEGLALYEAGQMDSIYRLKLAQMISNGKIPTVNELESDFGKCNGFAAAYTIVEYMIRQYGMGKVNELVRDPCGFRRIFHTTEKEFEKGWMGFVRTNYKIYVE